MASIAGLAPSRAPWRLQTARGWLARGRDALEAWLDAERDQLPLWLPVMIGAGVTAWFALPRVIEWQAAIVAGLGAGAAALAIGRGGRLAMTVAVAAFAIAMGVGLAWWRAERIAAPVLARPSVVKLTALVERVEPLPARDLVRLRLHPLHASAVGGGAADHPPPVLPPHIRVNLATDDVPAGVVPGGTLSLGARLMPPQVAGVPGAYDYSRLAWYDRIGASGRGFAPIAVVTKAPPRATDGLRDRLTRHIEAQLPGSVGGVAAAFVTGDVGAIGMTDADAMRRAGLAHLLSISGLHITAAVAFTMWLVMRLLALSPRLALTGRLPVVAAAAGAVAAVGYTLLSGAEVPTVRSCVAALLVIVALALGREAVTLRLVAAGALVVLLFWPEAMAGPSFQLSFAAVTAIIALHETPTVRGWFAKRDDGRMRAIAREIASLLLTGIVVELALMPIAVYHFHKAGLYGAIANIVAIPLSTFGIMPAEALALLLDPLGLSAPAWWLTGKTVALLLWIARLTAALPGSVTVLPAMPDGAFALLVIGGLWLALWRTRARQLGWLPIMVGAGWALLTPAPDLLVTGDGRHAAIRAADGGIALLRNKFSDYTADMMTVNGAVDGAPELLSDQRDARCSNDLCIADLVRGGRRWRILATRSNYHLDRPALLPLCMTADIIVSDRALPRGCSGRWLTLTPKTLRRTGGLTITLASGRIDTVLTQDDEHPWALAVAAPANRPGFRRRRSARDRAADEQSRGETIRPAPPSRETPRR